MPVSEMIIYELNDIIQIQESSLKDVINNLFFWFLQKSSFFFYMLDKTFK